MRFGTLNKPSDFLLSNLLVLEALYEQQGSKVKDYMEMMLKKHTAMRPKYDYPGTQHDLLFRANYEHRGPYSDCNNCDQSKQVKRDPRPNSNPVIHYGNIGSANTVMMNATGREHLKENYEVLCVEMEAGRIMDVMPCLVVRGVADYTDSHKNERWQNYAAAAAAGFMKEFLLCIPGQGVCPQDGQTETNMQHSRGWIATKHMTANNQY